MSIGIVVRDNSGMVTFDDQFLTMRVLQIIAVRDPKVRYAARNIAASEARADGVVAMVLPRQGSYGEGWNLYAGDSHIGTLPVVTVHDGYVRLAPLDIGRKATDGFYYTYTADIDIALVSLK